MKIQALASIYSSPICPVRAQANGMVAPFPDGIKVPKWRLDDPLNESEATIPLAWVGFCLFINTGTAPAMTRDVVNVAGRFSAAKVRENHNMVLINSNKPSIRLRRARLKKSP